MDIQGSISNSYYNYPFPLGEGSGQKADLSPGLPLGEATAFDEDRKADSGNISALSPSEEQARSDSQAEKETDASKDSSAPSDSDTNASGLTREELSLVNKLEKIDSEVRAHEMAHIAAGGQYITSGATFSYTRGPDGKNYATGGEVGIDTSAEPGDPQATLQKMRQVRAAALAPAEPSSQDMRVAAKAASQAAKAISEIAQLQTQEFQESKETVVSEYARQQASDAYSQTSDMPEIADSPSFETVA